MLDQTSLWRGRVAATFLATLLAACGGGGGGDADVAPPAAVMPVVTRAPAGQTADIGNAVTFSVAVQDATGITYQWLRDGDPIPGANQASYTLASAQATDNDSFWAVEVSRQSVGKVLTPGARLHVRPAAGMGLTELATAFPSTTRVLAVDSAGNLIVRTGKPYTSNGQALLRPTLRKVAPGGEAVPFGPAGVDGIELSEDITAAALDQSDNLYLAFTRFDALPAAAGEAAKVVGAAQGKPASSEVRRIDASGQSTLVFKSERGDADFVAVASLAAGATGTLYIGDAAGDRILRRSADGSLAKLGTASFALAYVGALPANQLAVGRSGQVYLASPGQRAVMKLNADGSTTILAGKADSSRAAQDGTGAQASFLKPAAPVVDAAGNLYVADVNSIRKVTPGGTVTTIGLPPQIQTFQALPPLDNLGLAADGAYYTGWGTLVLKGRLPQ